MADPTLVGELHGRVAEALSSWREHEEAGGRPQCTRVSLPRRK
jgi:hypothetical protein